MKTLLATRYVTIPEDVTVEVKSRIVTVTGPRGKLVQNFKHINLDLQMAGKNKLRVDLWFGKRKQVCAAVGLPAWPSDDCSPRGSIVVLNLFYLVAVALFVSGVNKLQQQQSICGHGVCVHRLYFVFFSCFFETAALAAAAGRKYPGEVDWCAVHSRCPYAVERHM